jgi:hypothetical protein
MGRVTRFIRLATLPIVAFALGACAQDGGRELARYYDEQGLFTVDLPAENEIAVTPPQPAQDGPGLLTGVVSSPPAPSPEAQSGLGGALASTEEPDQTIYQAFAVTADAFEDLDEMALYFLTGDPVVDVVVDDRIRVDGVTGRLVVADVRSDGEVTAGVAAALTLGDGRTAYLLAAVFPAGSWDDERSDFERVLRSFRTQVPPGLTTFPVASEDA